MDVLKFVVNNYDTIMVAAAAAHGLALAVVNMTHTPKAGAVVNRAYRMVEILAGIVAGKAKK